MMMRYVYRIAIEAFKMILLLQCKINAEKQSNSMRHRSKQQRGWSKNNEAEDTRGKTFAYNKGKDLYSSILQKGMHSQSYSDNYDQDYDDYYTHSSYLFMSENEEEEEIIRALSIPPPPEDDSDDEVVDENCNYDYYSDCCDRDDYSEDVYNKNLEPSPKRFKSDDDRALKVRHFDNRTKSTLHQNRTSYLNIEMNNYNTSVAKDGYKKNTTNSYELVVKMLKSGDVDGNNATNNDHKSSMEEQASNINLFRKKETIYQIIHPSKSTSKHGDNTISNDDKINDVSSTVADMKHNQSNSRMKHLNNVTNRLQRRNFIPSLHKIMNTRTDDNMNLPVEIPSSIDAIRARAAAAAAAAAASKSSSTHTRSNNSNVINSSFFQQQYLRDIRQQQQQQKQIHNKELNQSSPPQQKPKGTKINLLTANNQLQKDKSPAGIATKAAKKNNVKSATTMSLTTPWARQFILSRPKDSLLPIPREFLTDGFNLVQLAPIVESIAKDDNQDYHQQTNESPPSTTASSYPSLYKAALRLILEESDSAHFNSTKLPSTNKKNLHSPSQIQKAAEVLYTLVHARYVSSPRGLDTVRRMFLRNYEIGSNQVFGKCPRVTCNGTPLLPFGYSDSFDIHGHGGVERKSLRYCCCCGEAFYTWESKVDGSAWGPSFCHLFLMTYGKDLFSCLNGDKSKFKVKNEYEHLLQHQYKPIPRIFGFRIHPSANVKYPSF